MKAVGFAGVSGIFFNVSSWVPEGKGGERRSKSARDGRGKERKGGWGENRIGDEKNRGKNLSVYEKRARETSTLLPRRKMSLDERATTPMLRREAQMLFHPQYHFPTTQKHHQGPIVTDTC